MSATASRATQCPVSTTLLNLCLRHPTFCLQHSTYACNILPMDTTSYLHLHLSMHSCIFIGPSTLSYLYLLMTVNLHLVSTSFVALIQWKVSTYWWLLVFANFVNIFVDISSLRSVHLCLRTPEVCLFCHK
jgi:hypothetical protein